jgi:tRNA pseudouridine38-40 synthase
MKAEWTQIGDDEWLFEVRANAFLYRMVRRMVFVQAAVGQGKFPAETIARSLAEQASTGDRNELPAGLAPAHGLTLVSVDYSGQESVNKKKRNGELESVQIVLSESK